MKKTIALMLVLAAGCAFAPATAQDIEIRWEDAMSYIVFTLPEGAQVASSLTDGQFSMTEVEFPAAGKPRVIITTAADELYVGLDLANLPQEDVDRIIREITVEMAEPSVEIRVTPDGHMYIVANESTPANDTCDAVTLINGYFVMVNVFYADFSELTAEDQEIAPSIVETFRFVDNANT